MIGVAGVRVDVRYLGHRQDGKQRETHQQHSRISAMPGAAWLTVRCLKSWKQSVPSILRIHTFGCCGSRKVITQLAIPAKKSSNGRADPPV